MSYSAVKLKLNNCRRDDFTMSENFNARQNVKFPGSADAPAAVAGDSTAKVHNRRRSTRRPFQARVRVYGEQTNGNPFYEDAKTINVSVHGALLILTVHVAKGQKLLLFNEATQRQQVCQITGIRIQDSESFEVAVTFPTPHAEFWQVPPAPGKLRIPSKIN